MDIGEFQRRSIRTLNNELTKEEQVANMIIGMFSEGGEIGSEIKKAFYQGHELDRKHLMEELGDLMFYVVNLATLYDLSMENILDYNIEKLKKRYKNGFTTEESINRQE